MKLSQTMQEAIDKAQETGGKLYRHPGGFWRNRPYDKGAVKNGHYAYTPSDWFSTHTIKALVKRGVMAETAQAGTHPNTFCIEVSVAPIGVTETLAHLTAINAPTPAHAENENACQYNDGCGETPCVCGENAPEADPDDIDEPDDERASESEIYHAERSYEASRLR